MDSKVVRVVKVGEVKLSPIAKEKKKCLEDLIKQGHKNIYIKIKGNVYTVLQTYPRFVLTTSLKSKIRECFYYEDIEKISLEANCEKEEEEGSDVDV